MIKQYYILKMCGVSASEFQEEVQGYINRGWQPHGNLVFVAGVKDTYIQVLVKSNKG